MSVCHAVCPSDDYQRLNYRTDWAQTAYIMSSWAWWWFSSWSHSHKALIGPTAVVLDLRTGLRRPPAWRFNRQLAAAVNGVVHCDCRGAGLSHDHNNFNEEEIDALIEYLCTNWASWLYVYYLYFVRLKMFIYKPTVPVGDYCFGWWIRPLADNTILHLSELETGGVRLLGHQITSPPEQRRVVLLVLNITGVE